METVSFCPDTRGHLSLVTSTAREVSRDEQQGWVGGHDELDSELSHLTPTHSGSLPEILHPEENGE